MAAPLLKAEATAVSLKTLENGDVELAFVVPAMEQFAVRAGVEALRAASLPRIHLEAGKETKKRSLNANAYCWVLCQKIAEELSKGDFVYTKEDVYREQVRRTGPVNTFVMYAPAAIRFQEVWADNGVGWLTEDLDTDGEYLTFAAYYGSSVYDTAEMARLIDGLVQDCQQLGIETMTEEELESLKRSWRPSTQQKRSPGIA